MEYELLLTFLEKFGIMAVLGWFMLRNEKIISEHTKTLQELIIELKRK